MCSADVTLERPAYIGKSWIGPTGWGVAHSCRDWSYVNNFISDHAIPQASILPDKG